MSRTKAPVFPATGPIADLARELQELRARAGLTYEEMAPRARYGKTTLATADTGKRLPSREVVVAYAAACGGDGAHFGRRWDQVAEAVGDGRRHRPVQVRKRVQTPVRPARPVTPPDPLGVETTEEFRHRLWQLKDWASSSYRKLSIEANHLGFHLPRSTISDTLAKDRRGLRRLPDPSFVEAFVRACGLTAEEVELWLKVRSSLCEPPGGVPAGDQPTVDDGPAAADVPTPDVADKEHPDWWAPVAARWRRLRSRLRRAGAGAAEEGETP